jgi:hypothetical protein
MVHLVVQVWMIKGSGLEKNLFLSQPKSPTKHEKKQKGLERSEMGIHATQCMRGV